VVSVESAAHAHILAEKKLSDEETVAVVAGKVFNIAEESVTIPELANFIATEKEASVTKIPFAFVKFIAWLNEVVYSWTGLVITSESLSTTSIGYKTHTYVSHRAKQDLGWKPGLHWV